MDIHTITATLVGGCRPTSVASPHGSDGILDVATSTDSGCCKQGRVYQGSGEMLICVRAKKV